MPKARGPRELGEGRRGSEGWAGSMEQGWGADGEPRSAAEVTAGRDDLCRASGWALGAGRWLLGRFSQTGFPGC